MIQKNSSKTNELSDQTDHRSGTGRAQQCRRKAPSFGGYQEICNKCRCGHGCAMREIRKFQDIKNERKPDGDQAVNCSCRYSV